MGTLQELREKLETLPTKELIKLAEEEISRLCETGGKSFRMSIPIKYKDSDVILGEVVKRLKELDNLKTEDIDSEFVDIVNDNFWDLI